MMCFRILVYILVPCFALCTGLPHILDKSSAAGFRFRSSQQEELVNSLADYEIVVPEKVTESGSYVTHKLLHRSKRSLDPDSRVNDDSVHYRLNVNRGDVFVRLTPNRKLLAPSVVVERWTSGASQPTNASWNGFEKPWIPKSIRRIKEDHCLLRGVAINHTRSHVSLSACNGLMGYMKLHDDHFFIEPLQKNENDDKHHHIIYKRSALPAQIRDRLHPSTVSVKSTGNAENKDDACATTGFHAEEVLRRERSDKKKTSKEKINSRRKRSVSSERNVEALVVADPMMVEYYSNEDIETYILTVLNMVSELYRDASIGNAVNIALVRLILLKDEEQENELKVTHHADNSLKSFCRWQKQVNPKEDTHPNHHDVAILLTRYNICTRMNEPCSTLGLAEVAGMCQPLRSCNINEDTGLALAYTIAHEIGHNFGMNHDGPHNGCEPPFGERQHVMSPHLNSDTSPFMWSNCSRNEITKFLDRDWGTCLDDTPSEHEFVFPEVPPGVMYDTDHQCRLQYGSDASYCHEIEQDVCTSLWCRQENKCVTRLEPAAQGTRCGTNKWCFNGHCALMGERVEAINGEWGPWNEWSSCSRTCGAGVSHSERHCDSPPPSRGGHYCIGERKKYKICSTEACPDEIPSFRAEQCASFNSTPYKGEYHKWVPVSIRVTPCQLHCKPEGEFFSVMLSDSVSDGTPCNPGTRDMCINGKCRHVSCDWGIDSKAQEDRCGVCHGDGTQCQTVRGEFNQKEGIGYVDIVTIPAGSRNVRIQEVEEASSYIAIKDGNGTNRLNGNWLIQWSGDYDFPGTIMYYRREGELETMYAPGQLKEDMHIMLLYQGSNYGLKYEYTIPNANVTRTPEFHWEYSGWSVCTVTCGGGVQTSSAKCMEREAGLVEDKYCNATDKHPDVQRNCNKHQCPARWWVGPWQHCSVTCGNDGVRKRAVICIRSFGKDEQIALHDGDCEKQDKAAEIEPCHHKQPCPGDVIWKTGNWSDTCNKDPCNFQTRDVHCSIADGICDPSNKPTNQRQCGDITCGTWSTGNWSACSRSCGEGVQFRRVLCEGGMKCVDASEPVSIKTCQHNCDTTESTQHSLSATVAATTATTTATTIATTIATTPVPDSSDSNQLPTQMPSQTPIITKKADDQSVAVTTSIKKNSIPENDSEKILSADQRSAGDSEINNVVAVNVPDDNRKRSRSKKPIRNRDRPRVSIVDKVDPQHIKGVEITFSSKERYNVADDEARPLTEHGNDPSSEYDVNDDADSSDEVVKIRGEKGRSPDDRDLYDHQRHDADIAKPKIDKTEHEKKSDSSNEIQPEFEWLTKSWTTCSRPCSGGFRHREVLCYEITTETLVDNDLCDSITKPAVKETCNGTPCLEWQLTEWSECSHSCGEGVKNREVTCPKPGMCNSESRPKHVLPCSLRPCVQWITGPWSQCSTTCGGGSQLRHIKCVNPISQEQSQGCEMAEKPVHRQSCNVEECPRQQAAKFSACIDKLESSLCLSLRHMCSTWYFKVKCCHTCTKLSKSKTEPWADQRNVPQRHSGNANGASGGRRKTA